MHPEPTHLPVPAKAAVTSLLKSLAAELAAVGVLEVWLFGSVARGDDGPDSDIDIAIRVTKPRFAAKIAAEDILRPVSSGTSTWPFCRSPSAWATLQTTTSFGWSDARKTRPSAEDRVAWLWNTLNRPRVTTPSRFTVRSRLHWVGKTSCLSPSPHACGVCGQ